MNHLNLVCLICNKEFKSKIAISSHVRSHSITIKEYNEKFNLICHCSCGKEISCFNKTKMCNKHRDRTGENNPFFNKIHSKETLKILSQKCSIGTKKKWNDQEYRLKVIERTSKPRNKEFGKKQSIRIKNWFKENPDQRMIRSKSMKENWKNGIIVKNSYSSNSSNLEKELLLECKKIDNLFSDDITLKINKKWFFPDIIHLKKKIIIEFYGDYWHCNPSIYHEDYYHEAIKVVSKEIWNKDEIRIKNFVNEGYKVLVIWEKNFKENRDYVIDQIKLLVDLKASD